MHLLRPQTWRFLTAQGTFPVAFSTMLFEQDFSGGDCVLVSGQRVRFCPVFCGCFLQFRIYRGWLRFFRLALRSAQETLGGEQRSPKSQPHAYFHSLFPCTILL